MKPLNGYGRRNPADTDGIVDKREGSTPGTGRAKLNPPPESPAAHPEVCESGKMESLKFHSSTPPLALVSPQSIRTGSKSPHNGRHQHGSLFKLPFPTPFSR